MLHAASDSAQRKLEQILEPHYPLCKEDVVWLLDFIKKKVAEGDPKLLDLSQPRLLQNFRYFAETAMLLIHKRHICDPDVERLKAWVSEAFLRMPRSRS